MTDATHVDAGSHFCPKCGQILPSGRAAMNDELLLQKLREATELLDDSLRQMAHYRDEGEFRDWYDSCALSVVRDIGDWLVGEGLWERHPDGCGRQQFYRPKEGMG